MKLDLHRYLYASCAGKAHGRSLKRADSPEYLMPEHERAAEGRKRHLFLNRFRVQLDIQPATTYVSHLSRDDHYFIYLDPLRYRSFTVIQAARI